LRRVVIDEPGRLDRDCRSKPAGDNDVTRNGPRDLQVGGEDRLCARTRLDDAESERSSLHVWFLEVRVNPLEVSSDWRKRSAYLRSLVAEPEWKDIRKL